MHEGDTVSLICGTTGTFRGLVRIVRVPTDGKGLYTVFNETPILDHLTTGPNGEYPYVMPYEVGHRFNAFGYELQPLRVLPS